LAIWAKVVYFLLLQQFFVGQAGGILERRIGRVAEAVGI
jgi:hypothetical protein